MTLHALTTDLERLARDFEGISEVRRGEAVSRHTTFGIGGPADVYVVVKDEPAMCAVASAVASHGAPLFILGSGSNILVGDDGIRGVVVENKLMHVGMPETGAPRPLLATAGSGVSFASLARRTSLGGWEGLQWAVGIPGTIGGAVVYNAGAYGGCLGDVLVSIRAVDRSGLIHEYRAESLNLGYRGSSFTRGMLAGQIVLTADLALTEGEAGALAQRVAELDERRLAAQPRGRNAGSIFKNPKERPAWWLIDHVGLREHRIGDAQFSPVHANFIVNTGHARAADVAALICLAQQRVWEEFAVRLETEISRVGEGFNGS